MFRVKENTENKINNYRQIKKTKFNVDFLNIQKSNNNKNILIIYQIINANNL